MSFEQIYLDASSHINLYNSLFDKDIFKYCKIFMKSYLNSSMPITSFVKYEIDIILQIDIDICSYYLDITYNRVQLNKWKKLLLIQTCPHDIVMNQHYISFYKKQITSNIEKIYKCQIQKKESFQQFIEKEDEMLRPSFSPNITIMESNKLRGILRNNKKRAYLMNMSDESRNKRKNNREMNKLLFGKEDKLSQKHNKNRKQKSPNNKLYC